MTADQDQPTAEVTTYIGSQDLLETMGLEIVAGRDFTAEEFITFDELQTEGKSIPTTIITRTLAERLFPGESPLGRNIHVWGEEAIRIVGVVDRLIRPNDMGGPTQREYAIVLPVGAPTLYGHNYLLRVDDPGRREEILEAAAEVLERVDPNRILIEDETRTLSAYREAYYQQDRAMAWLLVAVCVALLVVTALGIVGLASFWVQQRTRQIGIRRALGATRGQVLRYFQMENLLIASIGIFIGMVLAFAINGLLMERYELPRLPWQYLPIGAVVLWVLGQGAVFGPARRAAAVPPAVATRSV
jgi:putative ABC transport system permease protein